MLLPHRQLWSAAGPVVALVASWLALAVIVAWLLTASGPAPDATAAVALPAETDPEQASMSVVVSLEFLREHGYAPDPP